MKFGYYIKFDGIEKMLATHSFGAMGLSGSFINCMVQRSLTIDRQSLDRPKMLVMLGGFGASFQSNAETQALFQSKGGTEAATAARINRTDTTVSFGSAVYANGSTVYIGRETVTLGTYTGFGYPITRGAHDSDPIEHGKGAIASSVPRFWRGRRAVLYSVRLDDGSMTVEAVTAGYMNSDIKLGKVFQMTFQGVVHKLNKQLLAGFREVKVLGTPTIEGVLISGLGDFDGFKFEVEDARQIAASSTTGAGFVMVTVGEKYGVYRVRDGNIDTALNTVTLVPEDFITGDLYLSFPALREGEVSMKQVQYLRDSLSRIAVQVLLSALGDLTNDPGWDVLPGRAPNFDAVGDLTRKSVGAGLPPSWVDVASFGKMPNTEIAVLIDEPIKVFDFLRNEILWRAGGMLYSTPEGAISFKLSEGTAVRSSLNVVDAYADKVEPFEIVEAESRLISRAEMQCNYIPGRGFTAKIPVTWAATEEEQSDNSPEMKIQSKSLWVGPVSESNLIADPEPFISLVFAFDRQRARILYGGRLIKMRALPSQRGDFGPLTRHSISNAAVPDLRGGTVSDLTAEVVSTKPNVITGQSEVELEELPRNWLLAGSAMVESWAPNVITFYTSGVLGNGTIFEDDPARCFPDDCFVILARKADNYAPSGPFEVDAILSATTMRLTSGPSPAPTDEDLIFLWLSDDTGSPASNSGADVLDHGFAADADLLVGAGLSYEEKGPRLA